MPCAIPIWWRVCIAVRSPSVCSPGQVWER
jgi:hypothetical protein